MSVHHQPAALTRRLPRPKVTVRARLTLLYGGVFLASGAILLVAVYLLVAHALPSPRDAERPGPPGSAIAKAANLKAQEVQRQNSSVLHQLLVGSSIALAVATLVAVVFGWLLARRVLRPLRTITRTTRGISEDNLHQRLSLPGPRDELKDLGDTIDGLLGRLEAAFKAQKSFVANASHELRTPLTLARATLQVALADPDLTLDSLRSACHEALDAGRQQEQLIEALLTLARSQRGLDDRRPVDLAVIANHVVNAHQAAAAALAIGLEVACKPAQTSGDAQLIERLVSNLIHNAMNYNHEGGIVHVLTDTDGQCARVQITNTGPHVTRNEITRLVQPFQRTDTERVTGDHDGIGLGLPIIQAIATAHGAHLILQPRPTGGLVVEVRFPRALAD